VVAPTKVAHINESKVAVKATMMALASRIDKVVVVVMALMGAKVRMVP